MASNYLHFTAHYQKRVIRSVVRKVDAAQRGFYHSLVSRKQWVVHRALVGDCVRHEDQLGKISCTVPIHPCNRAERVDGGVS